MKKVIVAILGIAITLGGILLINSEMKDNSVQTKNDSSSTKVDNDSVKFKIVDGNKEDLGRNISLDNLDSGEILFIFDYLPMSYYSGIFLDGKQVQQATRATKREWGFYLTEDAHSDFLKIGNHEIDIKIFKTKEDIQKDNVFEDVHFEYSIQK